MSQFPQNHHNNRTLQFFMSSLQTQSIFALDPEARFLPLKGAQRFAQNESNPALILTDPNYPHLEGRGLYSPVPGVEGRYYYVKGAGSREALSSSGQEDEWRKFRGIGHQDLSKYFFDRAEGAPTNLQDLPRVRGALALSAAISEFVTAEVFYKTLSRKRGIVNLAEAREKGICIPIAVVDSPGISSEIEQAIKKLGLFDSDNQNANSDHRLNYGIVVLEVSGNERLRRRDHINGTKLEFYLDVLSSNEKMQMVGRTLSHQLSCGFVSIAPHYQNIYNAPNSLCPHADHIDLVPISEILRLAGNKRFASTSFEKSFKPDALLRALVMRQFEYLPLNLLNIKDSRLKDLVLAGTHTILNNLYQNDWNFSDSLNVCTNFPKRPYSVLKDLANRVIEMGLVDIEPQVNWAQLARVHRKFELGTATQEKVVKAVNRSLEFERQLLTIELAKKN